MEKVSDHVYVLILAGGGGTRLWPLSREHSPKQFLQIFSGKSLFSLTWERAKKLAPVSHIFVSTADKYAAHIRKLATGVADENIITEPLRRDTALAMGLGALYISNRDPQAIVINLASDHLITPDSVFVADMSKAAQVAQDFDQVVTVGIKPRFPHTGMGYIKVGKKLRDGVLAGEKFIEKPELAKAREYTKSKSYYWNANLYVWQAKVFLDLLKKYAHKTVAQFPRITRAIGTDSERETLRLAFQMAPTISVDYAISEKLPRFVCISARFNWTDIGDWSEVRDNMPPDQQGNVILGNKNGGNYIGVNSAKNLLILDKQLITTVGVENLLIVDTPDAILICNVSDDQVVKQVHQMLKEQKLVKYL